MSGHKFHKVGEKIWWYYNLVESMLLFDFSWDFALFVWNDDLNFFMNFNKWMNFKENSSFFVFSICWIFLVIVFHGLIVKKLFPRILSKQEKTKTFKNIFYILFKSLIFLWLFNVFQENNFSEWAWRTQLKMNHINQSN